MIKKVALLLTAAMLLPILLFSCSGPSYETVMEYNGIELKENMYYYWISTFKRNILASYSDARDDDSFWGAAYDEERTVEEYFTEVINQRIMNYLIAQSLYKENKLRMPSDIREAIDADIKEKIEYYGSRGELNTALQELMLNINSLEDVYTWEEKHDIVFDYLYGENGAEAPSDQAITDYYTENYSRIKYIVFYTTKIKTDEDGDYVYDSNGQLVTEEMTEEELAAKKEKIEECHEKLKNGASFEELRKEYSEYDTSAYPNGFFVSSNELQTWGPDIILGAAKAKPGEIFRVDEEAAVYLILKCELTDLENLSDNDIKQLASLTTYASRGLYDEKFGALSENVKVYDAILSKYKLSEIKPNPYFSF